MSAMAHTPHGTIVSILGGSDVVVVVVVIFTSDNCAAINDDNNVVPSQFCTVRLALHGRGVNVSIFSISSRVGSTSSVVDLGVEARRRERDDDIADTSCVKSRFATAAIRSSMVSTFFCIIIQLLTLSSKL